MKSKMDEDQRARLRAIEPDKSFIVKAPAGSGKTGLLVKRYLRLLSLAESPEEIVAITFTRKASTEMRNQIQDALESALTKKKPENEYEEDRIKFATDVLKQDKKKKWHLFDSPDRLRIQTIDGVSTFLTQRKPVPRCVTKSKTHWKVLLQKRNRKMSMKRIGLSLPLMC